MPLLLILIPVVVIVYFALQRANELFLVSIRDGKLLLVRGRIPNALKNDFEDVVRRAQLRGGQLKAVLSSGHTRLVVSDMDEGVAQRMRNTFGTHSVQKLRAAPAPAERNLGQLVGIAWLAWMLRR